MATGRRWMTFRALLLVSAVVLVGYVAYRYSLYLPPDHGTLYGKIFPLSLLLALGGIALAVSPHLLSAVRGGAGTVLRGGVTAFGAVWMATGLACTRSLASGVVEAPLAGTLDLVHMLSGHVYLPVAVAALAWGSERLARRLGAPPESPAAAGEPALGAALP